MQTELRLIGSATRPKNMHPDHEIALCDSMTQAVRLSLMHARMNQEQVAERLMISESYMSLLMSGKRHWQAKHLAGIRQITGSMATLQWAAAQEGVDLHIDLASMKRAELRAQIEALKGQLGELEAAA